MKCIQREQTQARLHEEAMATLANESNSTILQTEAAYREEAMAKLEATEAELAQKEADALQAKEADMEGAHDNHVALKEAEHGETMAKENAVFQERLQYQESVDRENEIAAMEEAAENTAKRIATMEQHFEADVMAAVADTKMNEHDHFTEIQDEDEKKHDEIMATYEQKVENEIIHNEKMAETELATALTTAQTGYEVAENATEAKYNAEREAASNDLEISLTKEYETNLATTEANMSSEETQEIAEMNQAALIATEQAAKVHTDTLQTALTEAASDAMAEKNALQEEAAAALEQEEVQYAQAEADALQLLENECEDAKENALTLQEASHEAEVAVIRRQNNSDEVNRHEQFVEEVKQVENELHESFDKRTAALMLSERMDAEMDCLEVAMEIQDQMNAEMDAKEDEHDAFMAKLEDDHEKLWNTEVNNLELVFSTEIQKMETANYKAEEAAVASAVAAGQAEVAQTELDMQAASDANVEHTEQLTTAQYELRLKEQAQANEQEVMFEKNMFTENELSALADARTAHEEATLADQAADLAQEEAIIAEKDEQEAIALRDQKTLLDSEAQQAFEQEVADFEGRIAVNAQRHEETYRAYVARSETELETSLAQQRTTLLEEDDAKCQMAEAALAEGPSTSSTRSMKRKLDNAS